MRLNEFNQPIGDALPDFTPGEWPQINQLTGNFVTVEPINLARHFESAYEFYGPQSPQEQWTYLPMEAFTSQADFKEHFSQMAASKDPYYLAVVDKKTGQVVGTFSLMRIDPQNRSVEMGWVLYGPKLKRSRLATEAQYLVMKYVFETLHYRRYEWKCDHLNAPSKRAAERLGFKFEGTFRRANVYKGRSRDTDWHSMLAEEYAAMKPKFEQWLAPENFDEDGQQVKSLQEF
ncbi:GNAT family N-acetyltransferase [Limosilactobacillus gastricus]|uniref:GNAT family N-acetyltransferase n=1 Tax=Limosilactobacillus gastricus TaxID=227942 RepID=UPI0026ED76A4|nr:GNAT family protein [Limosilactobacillus gastricus]